MKKRPIKTKLLTALLTLCMVLSLAPISAFAESGAYAVKFYPGDYGTMTKNDQIPFVYYSFDDDVNKPYYYKLNVSETETLSFAGSIINVLLPNSDYEFAYWKADAAVYQVGSGTAIPAGTALSSDQLQNKITVKSDVTFTAHFKQISEYPDDSVITTATIENAKFDYQPGDAPQATAEVYNADADKYEIAYECWQEFENNEPVAAWYSDNGSHGSLPTFTEFESGKKYVYSLMLMPKDGYSFTGETVITVNEQKVSAPFVGGSMYIPSVKTITMPTVTVIDVVEINNVTVSFKDGDKPVFTGKVPDGAAYAFRCEWWELDSKTGAMSTDFGNFYENKITAFEAGKTYHYGVYVTTYGDVGNIQYIFSPDTKLKINGEFVNYTRYEGDESDGSDGTMWVLTDLAMTIIPEYKITEGTNGVWKQNSNDTLTFRANGDFSKFTGIKVDGITVPADKYTAASGSTVITLKKAYLGTLSVGKHTLSVVYSDGECGTEFEIKAAPHSHSYGTEWKYDGTSHWHECICGDKADTAAHTFEWVTDKEPTDDEKGSKHEECTVCHATRNEHTEIPATGEDCLFTKICKFIIKIITKFVLWILDFINGIC